MKKISIAIFLICFYTVIRAQPFYYGIKIAGNLNFAKNYLYVDYEAGSNTFTDSFLLTGKTQKVIKKLPQPVAAVVYIKNKKITPLNIFLANNTLNISITDKAVITNDKSDLQMLYLQLTRNDRIRPKYFPLYGELNAKNDSTGLTKLSVIFDSLRLNDITIAKNYLEKKKNSLLSLFAFMRYASFSADYAAAEPYFLQLPNWAKESADGKNIASKISAAKSVKINTAAPLFESVNPAGENVNLKNYRGQYILIDFWASWCGPCRKEHPALKELYSEYRTKNFNIISISLDDRKDNWNTAVLKDELPWINVSELKGFRAKTSLLYGVQTIPANFLINPDGIIIAKNSSPQELKDLLKKLLQ
jgi:thiol-disulfide isomerase/thioredoxin